MLTWARLSFVPLRRVDSVSVRRDVAGFRRGRGPQQELGYVVVAHRDSCTAMGRDSSCKHVTKYATERVSSSSSSPGTVIRHGTGCQHFSRLRVERAGTVLHPGLSLGHDGPVERDG